MDVIEGIEVQSQIKLSGAAAEQLLIGIGAELGLERLPAVGDLRLHLERAHRA